MDSDRWKQISELYGEALDMPAAERAAFLDARCGDDEVLRAELKSLLSLEAKPGPLDSAIAPDEFKPGSVIAGRFRIVRLVGHGGMGEVYEAEDLHLGERVGLKTIDPGVANNQNSIERFKREIQAAKKVTHPNVCRTYDVGFHPSSDDPKARIFLTMELLEGETLARRLASGPMTTREALPLIQQLADALGAAHKAGVIHRDFKSGNVMLTPHQGGIRAVIMDFGLARMFVDSGERSGNTITQTEGVAGTPDYMAPEQLTGGAITPATDIYAFGIVIYEMVTGHRPFQGDTPFNIAVRRLHQPPTSPRQLAPDLDPVWEEAILRCLASQPAERFQSTPELLAALSGKGPVIPTPRGWGRFAAVGISVAMLAAAVGVFMLRAPQKRSAEPAEWQQLTDFSDAATDPALSPDGRMLAFKRGGSWFITPGQIYVKLLPDGQPVQLTHDSSSKTAPVFSPDGSRLTYTVTRPGSDDWEIWQASVLPDGGDPRVMMSHAEGLSWIDKQHILFSEQTADPRMAVFTSTESRTAVREVYLPENQNWMAHFSTLSPDRRQVLIVEMQPGSARNYSTFFPCRLAPLDASSKGRQVGPVPGHCIAAAWSPDGKWMYFSARVDDKFHLWRQRPEGGEAEQISSGITQEEGLAIAPDGRSVITSVGIDQTTVWLHEPDGEHQISGEGDATGPQFAPDGKRVYYRTPTDLWVTDMASGHAERVLPGVSVAGYALSPDGKAIAYTTADDSLWYASLDRQAPPRMLAQHGRRPEFSLSGDIFFRAGSVLYRIRPDGTGRAEVPGNPGDTKVSISSLSPDEEWSLRDYDNGRVVAYSRKEGRSVPLCEGSNCAAGWTSNGKFFRIFLDPLSGQSGITGLIPLKGKEMLPPLPPDGVRTRADLLKIPGVKVFPSGFVSLAPDGASYAFVKQESRWNLYRIPLP